MKSVFIVYDADPNTPTPTYVILGVYSTLEKALTVAATLPQVEVYEEFLDELAEPVCHFPEEV